MRYKPFINIWQLYTKALDRRFEEIKTDVIWQLYMEALKRRFEEIKTEVMKGEKK